MPKSLKSLKSTVFAYAQGSDLDSVVEALEARLDALVAERRWALDDVWVVNQKEPPHWDLGLNLALPAGKARPKGWIDDVVAVATLLGALQAETKRAFVIGIPDAKTGAAKDLFFVDSASPDLTKLRSALESATA